MLHLLYRTAAAAGLIALAGCQSPGVAGHTTLDLHVAVENAVGSPPASTVMPAAGPAASAPAGFISFCVRNPDQCAAHDQPQRIVMDQNVWTLLVSVNDAVNQAVRPLEDREHYGRAEYWTLAADGYGDCDDFALTKRKTLLDAGFPSGALRIATGYTRRGNRHAVLTVATDKGDYVLDSINPFIVSWERAGYQWVARQDAQNAWAWIALAPGSQNREQTMARN